TLGRADRAQAKPMMMKLLGFSEFLTPKARAMVALITIGLPALLLAVVLIQPWAEPKWMFLDSLTAAELSGDCCHVYYGFISNLGILLWCGTAAVCFIAGACFYVSNSSSTVTRFAIMASLLTGWLALDDMFLLHELVLPSLGLPQVVVIGIYAILVLGYLGLNWRFIMQQEWWILAVGSGTLSLSVIVDTVFHSLVPVFVYLEDSAKFIGIVSWASFHLLTIFMHLTGRMVAEHPLPQEV
ncbi:MAG: hypothetical protein AAGF25_02610, partial [Pseudomonadota bacterium]